MAVLFWALRSASGPSKWRELGPFNSVTGSGQGLVLLGRSLSPQSNTGPIPTGRAVIDRAAIKLVLVSRDQDFFYGKAFVQSTEKLLFLSLREGASERSRDLFFFFFLGKEVPVICSLLTR